MRQLLQKLPFSTALGPGGEHDAGQSLPIDSPVRPKDCLSPSPPRRRLDLRQPQHLMCRTIGIQHRRPQPGKLAGHGALSARHAAQDAEDFHCISAQFGPALDVDFQGNVQRKAATISSVTSWAKSGS